MKTLVLFISIITLASCTSTPKEVTTIYDIPDNVYESLVLSFPDATDKELVDLYYQYKDKLDSLSYDEVIMF